MLLGHLDSGDRLAGWRAWGREPGRPLGARTRAESQLLRRLVEEGKTVTLRLEPGDEVLITAHNHPSNSDSWKVRAARDGMAHSSAIKRTCKPMLSAVNQGCGALCAWNRPLAL